MNIKIPYYRSYIDVSLPDKRIKAILKPTTVENEEIDETSVVERALQNPIGTPRLSELCKGKDKVLIITSDHTRPMPSRITMPDILKEIRSGNPETKIKIVVATGFHRRTTDDELLERFGSEVFSKEDIVVHNAFDDSSMVHKGTLPSGGDLIVNNLVDWADLVIAEGFIEPHIFAGFSGGRKSILPGICSKKTIMYNHNSRFIAHPNSKTGNLKDNLIHRDMAYAAKAAGLAFILNVALDENKKIAAAFAGDPFEAHSEGCSYVREASSIKGVKADLVLTSNGGYPLDQNIYQAVKSMTAALECLNTGGVMIVVSSCIDGHGGEDFYRWFLDCKSAADITEKINGVEPADTLPDQWEAQILARIITSSSAVIIVSEHVDPQLIADMHMKHAKSIEDALAMANDVLGRESEMVIIPDGVGVIVE